MAQFNYPVTGATLTSPFGDRIIAGKHEWHQGVDLAKAGTVPILAAADGVVIKTGPLGTYGNVVTIQHNINGKRMDTHYAHLRNGSIKVKEKQVVKQGQQLALMGSTGRSTGQHLHFEIHEGPWLPGQPNARNPLNYLGKSPQVTSPSNLSLVDYMQATGRDPSMANRKVTAKYLGIENYSGTAAQNVQMLEMLQAKDKKTVYFVYTGTVNTREQLDIVRKNVKRKLPNAAFFDDHINNLWRLRSGTFGKHEDALNAKKAIESIGYLATIKEANK